MVTPCLLRGSKVLHASDKCDPNTRQAYSAEECEFDEFLAEDDEYNKSDEPTVVRDTPKTRSENIQVIVPTVSEYEKFPTIYNDTDSVSTFQPSTPTTAASFHQPSSTFTPKIVSHASSSKDHISFGNTVPRDVVDKNTNDEEVSNFQIQSPV
jgi:hypothetical protein